MVRLVVTVRSAQETSRIFPPCGYRSVALARMMVEHTRLSPHASSLATSGICLSVVAIRSCHFGPRPSASR